jgi:muramoyltetrapeptide carboxypeptidase LdcA involved in peptidoglycan recycling
MNPFTPLDQVLYPPRCSPGDRVAIVSPSSAAAGEFPHIHERGIQRLRSEFKLTPVEYSSTRVESSPRKRADDLMSAFADPTIKAVMSTLGGDDQITVLKHLDFDVITKNPKPFFGYSDNTNLLNALVHRGMIAYHGGSTMVHLGRAGSMHPATESSLRAALFEGGWFNLQPSSTFANYGQPWIDPNAQTREPVMREASAWQWHGDANSVSGRLWGGCLEILDWTMQVGDWIADAPHYKDSILFIETSEEMPNGEYVFRTLRNMGERGILQQLRALIFARPISEPFGFQPRGDVTDQEVRTAEQDLYHGVLRALEQYNENLPCVLGVDAGHTDPQLILPLGGKVEIDMLSQQIRVLY